MDKKTIDVLKLLLTIFLVVSLGMIAVNQTMEFFYKSKFLKSPCYLCAELNPGVEQCINNLNKQDSYWSADGWIVPNNLTKVYNITIDYKK
jgi:hypothetical protein|tara:strand:+ start:4703 stop:4975 length:273 start_codon:yes stop_codon:yes gene_type:complete